MTLASEAAEPVKESNSNQELLPILEAMLFAYGEPLALGQISQVLSIDQDEAELLVSQLRDKYQEEHSGIELVEVAKKYQIRTKESMASFIQELKATKPKKLSPVASIYRSLT